MHKWIGVELPLTSTLIIATTELVLPQRSQMSSAATTEHPSPDPANPGGEPVVPPLGDGLTGPDHIDKDVGGDHNAGKGQEERQDNDNRLDDRRGL